jgi:hypothetical protein
VIESIPINWRMLTISIQLTTEGLGNIPNLGTRNDFAFIVGERRYMCPWYVANYLSPTIAQLQSMDPTISAFQIESIDTTGLFGNILTLGRGGRISFSPSDQLFYVSVFRELGNSEAIRAILDCVESDMSISNAVQLYRLRSELDQPRDDIVSFIASHFSEFSQSSSFDCLSDFDIELILSHRSLQFEHEDVLYDFVSSRILQHSNSLPLLEFIQFEYLSIDRISRFCQWSHEFFNLFNDSIWSRICSRLAQVLHRDSPDSQVSCPRRIVFTPDPHLPLDGGLISYLSEQCGGNVHDKQIVQVSASSTARNSPACAAKNLVDLKADSLYVSRDAPNQWICYDFGQLTIAPTHYSIRSRFDGGPGWNNIKSWVIEGSGNGDEWTEVDRREGNDELKDKNVSRLFEVTNSGEFRFIRLRQTGTTHDNKDFLTLSGFEIFGTVVHHPH